jgi:urea carboxylase
VTGPVASPVASPSNWPFDTVLIANRGEIACRIQRTVRALGLRSVAVHSDADRGARHVLEADEAVRLGPAPAAESYLRAEAVVEAALATGAGAVHPGYGLLAESASFARLCQEAGLRFIGPTADQIEAFGAKHTARRLAARSGVPLVPGTDLITSDEEAVAAAGALGWPVMVKASAGGGGIGLRRCDGPDELLAALEAVRRLAANNFGSADVFLERYVAAARHIEVQVFGDGRGRIVTLGDRDCSVQRRNQKLLEESPAPGIGAELRARLAEHASSLAASVDYRSAGTVEFVVDTTSPTTGAGPGDGAWFLEMNTRLQVEHTITEATHGIDLVAWMIRLAAGDPLPELDAPPSPLGWRWRPGSVPRTRPTATGPAPACSPA